MKGESRPEGTGDRGESGERAREERGLKRNPSGRVPSTVEKGVVEQSAHPFELATGGQRFKDHLLSNLNLGRAKWAVAKGILG